MIEAVLNEAGDHLSRKYERPSSPGKYDPQVRVRCLACMKEYWLKKSKWTHQRPEVCGQCSVRRNRNWGFHRRPA